MARSRADLPTDGMLGRGTFAATGAALGVIISLLVIGLVKLNIEPSAELAETGLLGLLSGLETAGLALTDLPAFIMSANAFFFGIRIGSGSVVFVRTLAASTVSTAWSSMGRFGCFKASGEARNNSTIDGEASPAVLLQTQLLSAKHPAGWVHEQD